MLRRSGTLSVLALSRAAGITLACGIVPGSDVSDSYLQGKCFTAELHCSVFNEVLIYLEGLCNGVWGEG